MKITNNEYFGNFTIPQGKTVIVSTGAYGTKYWKSLEFTTLTKLKNTIIRLGGNPTSFIGTGQEFPGYGGKSYNIRLRGF